MLRASLTGRAFSLPLLAAGILALLAVIAVHASVMEDPYITFRVVDHVTHGMGLRWNSYERVQPYTDPLWMLIHIPLYAVWENIYFNTLLISLICSLIAIILPVIMLSASRPALVVVCLFLIPLAASRCFTAYSTSGFENPLEHCLFALAGWVLLRERPAHFWGLLSLCTSLSLVTRLDTLILYAPIWLYLLASRFRTVRWRQVALGLLPLISWELFSLFYYGFPFPNSKYAKLNTGTSEMEYLRLGISYFLNLLAMDTVSALSLIAAMALGLRLAWRYAKTRDSRTGLFMSIAAGIVLYSVYVVYVGGTYLPGRFFSFPVYAAVWLLACVSERLKPDWRMAALACACVALPFFQPNAEKLKQNYPIFFDGVNLPSEEEKIPLSDVLRHKTQLPQPRVQTWDKNPVVCGSIGKWGYSMKPEIKIVDYIALGDPLLARLPLRDQHIETTGILARTIPDGYLDAIATGNLDGMDPALAHYYAKLRFIVSGDLWDASRLWEIVKFNAGYYDYLLDLYARNQRLHPAAKGK